MMFHHLAGLHRVHFIGIGGAGMSGIAELLLDYRLQITGSDLQRTEVTARLEKLGVCVRYGHEAAHVVGADLVVVSSAIVPDNVELHAARERGITVVRRAEMLAELMRLKYGIAIAGTHGKTTTTSLVGTVLTEAGLDPTVLVGGRLRVSGTGARIGKSDYLVAEADEFDRSFLALSPVLAVITSIDVDHLDTYRGLQEIQEAFLQFASRVPFFGQVILCLDEPRVQELIPRLQDRRVVTYGFSPQADYSAQQVAVTEAGMSFVAHHVREGTLAAVELPLPGEHNVRNALAAIAVCRALGLEPPRIAAGLEAFRGVHRRFERLGSFQGAAVVDDYAHHPTEVIATLRAARQVYKGEIHVVFQPHLYTRTRDLAADFGRALLLADSALVTEIYGSREQPIPGVSGRMVVEAARAGGHRRVRFVPDTDQAVELLRSEVRPGDAVLLLGAGDIYKLAHELAGTEVLR
ncbi:MAG TPA: UDP-N-acetylmuramate--L-alanine ligase [Thermoanaerobaculia bacterium]|nr:UDP-N-acetylmuramate--L-alanine ligase [Thermoanaerobaculia bacterium]